MTTILLFLALAGVWSSAYWADAMFKLSETPLESCAGPITKLAAELIAEGLLRGKGVDCFDWVPSNYQVVHATLAALPRGRFCEWGSGMGIATGLAALLGFEARGIELDAGLAAASRTLLAEFGLSARIDQGDYFEIPTSADVYFTYSWPSQICRIEEHLLATAPAGALFLICHGAEDIRGSRKSLQSTA